ncbi:Hpt domain-containing protein [Rubellimicrobium mesophilum]|uniref:Hpt domain-containing protein n=1 Tax=Rubellimicrobium mesophilum TaxID=1123067 RepID=UPI000688091E|nr:Hpt domain-containing protein [Rubellimicrobium mesophilum]
MRRSVPRPGIAEGLDAGLLATLARTLDTETVLALLNDLGAEADRLPVGIEAAGEAGDAGRVDRLLHSLKGAAATLGLAGVAQRLQDLRGAGPIPASEVREVCAEVGAGIEAARTLLRAASGPVAA